MKFELEFHDSEITNAYLKDNVIEIELDAVLIVTDPDLGWLENEDHRIQAKIIMGDVTTLSIPSPGTLFDGDISISNRPYKGVIPISLSQSGEIELTLINSLGSYSIRGKTIHVVANANQIPEHLREKNS